MSPATVRKPSDPEADWDQKSLSAAADAAREVIGEGINGRAMVSSLSELEWGWIAAAAVFAYIKARAVQAVEEGRGYDETIRAMPNRDPQPWEAGAIEMILPSLSDLEKVDWSKPVGEWSKPEIVSFAWQIHRLVNSALAARDEGAKDKLTRRLGPAERELSAAHGGPLMTRTELNDDVPF